MRDSFGMTMIAVAMARLFLRIQQTEAYIIEGGFDDFILFHSSETPFPEQMEMQNQDHIAR